MGHSVYEQEGGGRFSCVASEKNLRPLLPLLPRPLTQNTAWYVTCPKARSGCRTPKSRTTRRAASLAWIHQSARASHTTKTGRGAATSKLHARKRSLNHIRYRRI